MYSHDACQGPQTEAILLLQKACHAAAYLVDLLVDLRAVMEAHLTSALHCPLYAGWMPGPNAGNLAQTPMGLARQAGDTPALHHTLHSKAPGDGDGVDHLYRKHKGKRVP